MFTAIEPEAVRADGGVDEGAMMGSSRAGMGMRAEMPAGDAQALDRDGARDLQAADEADLGEQQIGLLGRRELGQGGRKLRCRRLHRAPGTGAFRRQPDGDGAGIDGIGAAFQQALALQGGKRVCWPGLGDAEMSGNVLRAHAGRAAGEQAEDLGLRRIQPRFAGCGPQIGALDHGDALEALAQAGDQVMRILAHADLRGVLNNNVKPDARAG